MGSKSSSKKQEKEEMKKSSVKGEASSASQGRRSKSRTQETNVKGEGAVESSTLGPTLDKIFEEEVSPDAIQVKVALGTRGLEYEDDDGPLLVGPFEVKKWSPGRDNSIRHNLANLVVFWRKMGQNRCCIIEDSRAVSPRVDQIEPFVATVDLVRRVCRHFDLARVFLPCRQFVPSSHDFPFIRQAYNYLMKEQLGTSNDKLAATALIQYSFVILGYAIRNVMPLLFHEGDVESMFRKKYHAQVAQVILSALATEAEHWAILAQPYRSTAEDFAQFEQLCTKVHEVWDSESDEARQRPDPSGEDERMVGAETAALMGEIRMVQDAIVEYVKTLVKLESSRAPTKSAEGSGLLRSVRPERISATEPEVKKGTNRSVPKRKLSKYAKEFMPKLETTPEHSEVEEVEDFFDTEEEGTGDEQQEDLQAMQDALDEEDIAERLRSSLRFRSPSSQDSKGSGSTEGTENQKDRSDDGDRKKQGSGRDSRRPASKDNDPGSSSSSSSDDSSSSSDPDPSSSEDSDLLGPPSSSESDKGYRRGGARRKTKSSDRKSARGTSRSSSSSNARRRSSSRVPRPSSSREKACSGSAYRSDARKPRRGRSSEKIKIQAVNPTPQPEKFEGCESPEESQQWLNHFEMFARSSGWERTDRCEFIKIYLSRAARDWRSQLSTPERYNWKVFRSLFIKEFCTARDTALDQYLDRRQRRSETAKQYWWAFNALANKARVPLKRSKEVNKHVNRFLKGLRDQEIKRGLRGREFHELSDVTSLLKRLEDQLDDDEFSDPAPRRKSSGAKAYVVQDDWSPPVSPRKSKHVQIREEWDSDYGYEDSRQTANTYRAVSQPQGARGYGDRRFSSAPGETRREVPVCDLCKKQGHYAKDCWGQIVCSECNARGHPSEFCYRRCDACNKVHDRGTCPGRPALEFLEKMKELCSKGSAEESIAAELKQYLNC